MLPLILRSASAAPRLVGVTRWSPIEVTAETVALAIDIAAPKRHGPLSPYPIPRLNSLRRNWESAE